MAKEMEVQSVDGADFIKRMMCQYPVAAHEAYFNAPVVVQVERDVAQALLEIIQKSLIKITLREHQESRRRAKNYYSPEAESVLDELLDRYDYYTGMFGLTNDQAFAAIRDERNPAVLAEIKSEVLPSFDL